MLKTDLLLAGTFLLATVGCSTASPPEAPADFHPSSIELYLSRANLVETEFEQFKAQGSKLFIECGKIRRGRFVPQNQDIFPLSESEQAALYSKAYAVKHFANRDFDKPGDNSSLIDPGQALVTITVPASQGEEKTSVKTSVDAVSSQISPADTAVYQLASTLRKASGGSPCGNKSFYGIR